SCVFFFSSRRRHTRFSRDWSSDVCSSDLIGQRIPVRANTSSCSTAGAIRSDGSVTPSRTTIVAVVRSMRSPAAACAASPISSAIANTDAPAIACLRAHALSVDGIPDSRRDAAFHTAGVVSASVLYNPAILSLSPTDGKQIRKSVGLLPPWQPGVDGLYLPVASRRERQRKRTRVDAARAQHLAHAPRGRQPPDARD